MKKDILFPIIIILIFCTGIFLLLKFGNTTKRIENTEKVKVVTTLFPLYDFTKNIGGEYVDVSLLLPPGVESHGFEPKPSDLLAINEADVFVYTGEYMEPWVIDIIKSIDTDKVKVVDASKAVLLIKKGENHEEEHKEESSHEDKHDHDFDPHIWLDFDNAKIMVNNIKESLISKNSAIAPYVEKNTESYNNKLDILNSFYKENLKSCTQNKIVYGGHYAFGYLAEKYNLSYEAAMGISPDSEPTVKDLVSLIKQVKDEKIEYVFYEELASPRVAETIASEAGVKMLLLNAAHNLSKEQIEKGLSYTDIMQSNLDNLIIGLNCK
jgi:zinc transport system substrate-binding protein